MAKKMKPMHAGEVLREEFLVPLEMSAGALAKACGLPRTRIERIATNRPELRPIPRFGLPRLLARRRSSGSICKTTTTFKLPSVSWARFYGASKRSTNRRRPDYADFLTALSTRVLPSDQIAPGTLWLPAITVSNAVSIHLQSSSERTSGGSSFTVWLPWPATCVRIL